MSTSEHDEVCNTIFNKLSTGQHLDAAEKAHLGKCESCLDQVMLRLDERADSFKESAPMSPEIKQALERGRRVLVRELGLQYHLPAAAVNE